MGINSLHDINNNNNKRPASEDLEGQPDEKKQKFSYSLDSISPEICLHIFSFLNTKDVKNLSQVCKKFLYLKNIFNNDIQSLTKKEPDVIQKIRHAIFTFNSELLYESVPAQVQFSEDALTIANVIAKQLGIGPFTSFSDVQGFFYNHKENADQLNTITELDLSKLNLSYLPPEITFLKNLKKLNLNGNFLVNLPFELQDLHKLEEFHCNNNRLLSIPEELGFLEELRVLDLSGNNLTKLPKQLGNLINLEKLNFCKNPLLESVPYKILCLTFCNIDLDPPLVKQYLSKFREDSLKVANIITNELKIEPFLTYEKARDWLNDKTNQDQLKNITELDLSNQNLSYLLPEISNLNKLNYLCLIENKLKQLPDELFHLKNLNTLDCSDNELTEISEEIGQSNLEILNVENNKLTELPIQLNFLTSLIEFFAADNSLNIIPESLMKRFNENAHFDDSQKEKALQKFEEDSLIVFNNFAEQLKIGGFSNLKTAQKWLDKNKEQLKSVIFLDLSEKNLHHVPPEIGYCSELQSLSLSHNNLDMLPDELFDLSKLKRLDLEDNKLTTISKKIGRLLNLNTLDLSNNKLTTLPDEIGGLLNLTNLNIELNNLKDIPEPIKKLTECKIFKDGNFLDESDDSDLAFSD